MISVRWGPRRAPIWIPRCWCGGAARTPAAARLGGHRNPRRPVARDRFIAHGPLTLLAFRRPQLRAREAPGCFPGGALFG